MSSLYLNFYSGYCIYHQRQLPDNIWSLSGNFPTFGKKVMTSQLQDRLETLSLKADTRTVVNPNTTSDLATTGQVQSDIGQRSTTAGVSAVTQSTVRTVTETSSLLLCLNKPRPTGGKLGGHKVFKTWSKLSLFYFRVENPPPQTARRRRRSR